MTTHYLGMSRGAEVGEDTTVVTIGTSTTIGDMGIYWVSTNNPTKQDLRIMLETLKQFIDGNGMQNLQTNISAPTNGLPVL